MNKINKNVKRDLTGQVCGKWKVLSFSRYLDKKSYWNCQCECGLIREVNYRYLINGDSKSCGCKRPGRKKKPVKEPELSNCLNCKEIYIKKNKIQLYCTAKCRRYVRNFKDKQKKKIENKSKN